MGDGNLEKIRKIDVFSQKNLISGKEYVYLFLGRDSKRIIFVTNNLRAGKPTTPSRGCKANRGSASIGNVINGISKN